MMARTKYFQGTYQIKAKKVTGMTIIKLELLCVAIMTLCLFYTWA